MLVIDKVTTETVAHYRALFAALMGQTVEPTLNLTPNTQPHSLCPLVTDIYLQNRPNPREKNSIPIIIVGNSKKARKFSKF